MESPYEINRFMEQYRVSRGTKDYTHVTMGKKAGIYKITDTEKLHNLYNKAIFEYDIELTILERQPETCCLFGDIDLKYPVSLEPSRKYSRNHIIQVIKIYHKIIKELMNASPENLDAFVFERESPYIAKGAVKDGFHFMMLGIVCDKKSKELIHRLAQKELSKQKVFDDTNVKNKNDIIDISVSRNNWFMYGSSKPNIQPYKATFMIKENMQVIPVDIDQEAEFPKLFSLNKDWKATALNPGVDIQELLGKSKASKSSSKKPRSRRQKKTLPEHFEEVTALVPLLSEARADNYNQWLEVGFCLHDIDSKYLPLWVEFSKKSKKFNSGECERKWKGFRSGNWKLGSLYWWAKEDSPKEYIEFLIRQTDPVVEESIRNRIAGTSYDVARVVQKRFQWEFVCASIQFKQWYHFNGIKWDMLDRGVVLRQHLSNDIFKQYCRMSGYMSDLATEITETEERNPEKDECLRKAKSCNDLARKLRTRNFKQDVMADCADLFHDSKFLDRLDENKYLLGFDNGVLDLNTMEFRNARPDDYMSKSVGMNFPEKSDAMNEDKAYIKNVIKQIITDPEVLEYFWLWAASCLDGHTQQLFPIGTGNGSNGKTLLFGFLKDTMGDYAVTLPVSLITNKRAASNSATPEIARTKGCRLGLFQEPESNATLNGGLIKELTGKDEILGRELYKPIVAIKPQIQMVMMCNDLPKVNDTDGGVWRRLTVIPFESKFTNDPELLKLPKHFPKDERLDDELNKRRPAMISILLEYYEEYKNKGRELIPPKKIMVHTKKYQSCSDVYAEFIGERLDECGKDIMGITQLYSMFRQWYKDNSPDNKCPNRTMLKTYLDKYYSKLKKKSGWKFKVKIDEEEQELFSRLENGTV